MKLKRHGAVVAALLAAAALVLSACGSNPSPSGGGATASVDCTGKANLTGEGSSAQKNAVDAFVQAYQAACPGKNVAYNATGSGAGVKQFNAGLVDFGGSDSPLSEAKGETAAAAARCKSNPAWNIPMVFGPLAVAYNLSGVNGLILNGETTAKIFNGAIKTWNDPAIAALNPGVTLPTTPIAVIFRSDESGTTDNFQLYLTAASKGAWTQGAGKKFNGGVGTGAPQSAGVAQAIGATAGSIGYVEVSFAKQNKLQVAKIDTGSGAVELTDATAAKAIEGAQVKGTGNDLVLDLNSIYATTTPGAYPIVLATYELVCSKGYDADTAKAVKAFLTAAATTGQAKMSEIGYVPLPDSFKTKVQGAINAISTSTA